MAIVLAAQNGNWSAGATWVGGAPPGPGDVAVANGKAITVDASVAAAEVRNDTTGGAANGGGFILADGVTLAANIIPGSNNSFNGAFGFVQYAGAAQAYIVGTIYGANYNTVYGSVQMRGPGTLHITGAIICGSGGGEAIAVYIIAGSLNFTGAITGPSSTGGYAVFVSAGIATLTAAIAAGDWGSGINNVSGTLTVTGNITGGALASAYGISIASAAPTTLNGNVTGGAGSSAYGANISGAGNTIVNGNVTAGIGSGAHGLSVNTASAAMYGAVAAPDNGGSAAYGIHNVNGTVFADTVQGNGYGPGGSVPFMGWAIVNNANSSRTYLNKIIVGARGQMPLYGAGFYLQSAPGNAATLPLSDAATKTLYSSDAPLIGQAGVADVRAGVEYANGLLTGACAVPPAGSVALAVPVDPATRTARQTQADTGVAVWAAPSRTLTENLQPDLSPILADTAAILARIAAQVPDGPVVVVPAPGAINTTIVYGYALDNDNAIAAGVPFELLLVKTPGTTAPLSYPAGARKAVSDANGRYTFAVPRGTGVKFKVRRGNGSWIGLSGVDAESLALPELLG
jgi:hypothetical protein